ncbi:unnamed protein product [Cuscuta campestris]|uniref:Dynamin-type G domain-containing protein n=1 Tax=Cuscuta campestris TaxID=132261 RepID=A0A484LLJ7_9ASTE|nr:unnamed protein product [Cuscuta campestris]
MAAAMHAPIISSYNNGRIRPLLDCVDKLRALNVMQEGIQLPTIVVVGDQSSGKSSVLESLAGISLPRGQGMSTRVPLVMRLKNQPDPETPPEIYLEFNGKIVPTDEAGIEDAIISATDEVAGCGKGISRTPLTLLVKKCGVPDLTMVDLPGITRVPVKGQPHDIYEQIRDIIMDHITSEESIILNVLSATVDFPTCESIRMSQAVDPTGRRTLAVVTKADIAPQGLLEKVTADEVRIGLGYVCVSNRTGSESELFDTHPLLSKIDKSMVSIPVLADKLVSIQENIISKCLPDIVKKIQDKLAANLEELNALPKTITSVGEGFTALIRILNSTKRSLTKLLLAGDFGEYPEDTEMHIIAKLMEMLNRGTAFLKSENIENQDEISDLEMGLSSGFLPHRAFLYTLQKRLNRASPVLLKLVGDLWAYIQTGVINVLSLHCENHPQIQSGATRAVENMIAKKKEESARWVTEIIGMEKLGIYTCNDNNPQGMGLVTGVAAYWEIVRARVVDGLVLHILFKCQKLVEEEMEEEVVRDLTAAPSGGGGIERMVEESSLVAEERERLRKRVELLQESQDVVAKIIGRIVPGDD